MNTHGLGTSTFLLIVYVSRIPTSKAQNSRSRVVSRRSWYEGVYMILSEAGDVHRRSCIVRSPLLLPQSFCPSSVFYPTKNKCELCSAAIKRGKFGLAQNHMDLLSKSHQVGHFLAKRGRLQILGSGRPVWGGFRDFGLVNRT